MSATPTLPFGFVPFGPETNCTLKVCPVEASIVGYRPSIPANSVFIGIFGLCFIFHLIQGYRTKAWVFMAGMLVGCTVEILGYVCRLLLNSNPFNFFAFLTQIICITVAPVFFCAAVYVLLAQVVDSLGRNMSRFEPRLLYWVFIPCDVVSLILQAVGGALSSEASTKAGIQVGVNVSLAGLCFQVFTLTVFCLLFFDYLRICWKTPIRRRFRMEFMVFLGFMFLSVFFILSRCAYRIMELGQGYFGRLFQDESFFIAFESVLMCFAVICLNIGHPGTVLSKQKTPGDGRGPFDMDNLPPRIE